MVHLTRLFNLMIKHGFVPSSFGEGVIVPLLKDKSGDIIVHLIIIGALH